MNEYMGQDAASLQELLNSCNNFQEKKKIRAALKEAQGLKIGSDGIITQSFNPRHLRKSSSDGSPLNSPKSPKSPSLRSPLYRRQVEERTFQDKYRHDEAKSKWFHSSSLRETPLHSETSQSVRKKLLLGDSSSGLREKPLYSETSQSVKEKLLLSDSSSTLREKSVCSEISQSVREKSLLSDKSPCVRESLSYGERSQSLRDDIESRLKKYRERKRSDDDSDTQISNGSEKKERIPSWREALKDEMECHSSSYYSNRSNNTMSKTLASDREHDVTEGRSYRSVYHIGSIGVQKNDRQLLNSDNNRRKKFTTILKSDGAELDQKDFRSPRHSRRHNRSQEDSLDSSKTPRKYYSSLEKHVDLPVDDKEFQTTSETKDAIRRPRGLDCQSADTGYRSERNSSEKETTENDQFEYTRRLRVSLDKYGGSTVPSAITSRTVWRSTLQDKEISDRPLFEKSRSPSSERETTLKTFERTSKMPRNKSDNNLLDMSSTGHHNSSSQDLDNDSVFEDNLNSHHTKSKDGLNESPLSSPVRRSMTRNHSDSNLSELSVVSRTTSRASLYGSGDFARSPVSSRKSSDNDSKESSNTVSVSQSREKSPSCGTPSAFNRLSMSAEIGTSSSLKSRLKDIHNRYSSDSELIRPSREATEEIDVEKDFKSVEEILQEISFQQDKLKQCTEFAIRRKIRAAIRKLREKRDALESCDSAADKTSSIQRVVSASPCAGEITPSVDRKDDTSAVLNGYSGVDSIPELRRLLSEESDYDEKRKIRLALRQLRQKKNEREGGGRPVNARNLGRSQSFVEQRQQSYHNRPADRLTNGLSSSPSVGDDSGVLGSSKTTEGTTNGYTSSLQSHVDSYRSPDRTLRRSSDIFVAGQTEKSDKEASPKRRNSSFIPESGSNVFKSSRREGVKNHLKSFASLEKLNANSNSESVSLPKSGHTSSKPPTSSSPSSSPVKDRSGSQKSTSNQCQKSLTSKLAEKKNSNNFSRRFSLSEIGQSTEVKIRKSEDKKTNDFENQGKEWIENKKRSCSLPGNDKNLSSVDMEAAFSELLSAVDKQESVDIGDDLELITEDINKNKTVNAEVIDELIRTGQQDAATKREECGDRGVQDVNGVNGDISMSLAPATPQTTLERPTFLAVTPDTSSVKLPEKNSAISVVEDDDGSVTVHSVSQNVEGDQVITEKTRLRRTESNTETEERDTIIESKITTPGGSAHYQKDITQSKRKLTSRGSDYFSRNKYVIKRIRNPSGDETEQHDLSVETDNFSATQCEAWGDRAEAKVQMSRSGDTVSSLSANTGQTVATKTGGPGGRMDISKTSSGYGSVSGSDEEEKEEVTLSANTGYHGRPSGCPEIRATLKDVVVLEGSTALLECTVMCSPDPTITWFKGDKKLDKSARFDPKFDSASGKASLSIKRAGADDRGEYKCLFKNPLGEADTRAKLTVKTKAIRKPEFKKRLKEQTVTEGCSVELACVVHDASSVSWYKDGIIQRNSADFKQTFDGVAAKLEISEIFLDDKGEYACVAKNDLGESKTVCKINVKECDGDTNTVPKFLTKPGSKVVNSNDTILLECDVVGTPQLKIQWLKDGCKLTPTRRQKESFDGRVASLKIQSSTQEDSGKYECVATNDAGKATVDALVVVKAKQGPPIILHPLTDLSAPCGKPLTLQCDVRATPTPMVTWRKDGRVIGNTKDFKQTYEDNMARLNIAMLHDADGGCYECVAKNSYGAVTSMCNLSILAADALKPKSSPKVARKDNIGGKMSATDIGVQRQTGFKSALTKERELGLKRSESLRVSSTVSEKLEDKDDKKSVLSKSIVGDAKSTPAQENKEPAWKNVKLRRAESARVTPANRPSWWREKGESDIRDKSQTDKIGQDKVKQAVSPLACDSSSKPPVVLEKKTTDSVIPKDPVLTSKTTISLRRSESARLPMTNTGKKNFLARAIDFAMEKDKQTEINNNNNKMEVVWTDPSSTSSTPSFLSQKQRSLHNTPLKEMPEHSSEHSSSLNSSDSEDKKDVKLSRTQSARLLFEKNCQSPQSDLKPNSPVANFLARQNNGVRRTSSLKVTPTEKEAGWFRNRHTKDDSVSLNLSPVSKGEKGKDSFGSSTVEPATMTNYDRMDDEEELHKILSKTEDFEERKKIRARMKEIREKKQKEWEEKRLQREKEHEDIVKKKFQMAEDQKKKKLEQFQKDAKVASAEREKILATSESLLQDKLKQADEDKRRHLEVFDKLAQKGDTKTQTTVTTENIPGGTRTTVIKKTETTGFGGISYGKPTAEQAAKYLSDQLKNAASSGTEGRISVKTESWSSRDGVTHTTQKTETWGGKPGGGAMAAFKQMDSSATPSKPNALVTLSYAKKAATTMRRNAAAIKQEILSFCKQNTKEYEGVDVTNFSSSWNNGMAFCALIHHFYPESFDFKVLNPKARRANFKLAFDMAEKHADIAPLLDVDDMVAMKNPDWKCVFTYVQSFYRKLHNHAANQQSQASEQ